MHCRMRRHTDDTDPIKVIHYKQTVRQGWHRAVLHCTHYMYSQSNLMLTLILCTFSRCRTVLFWRMVRVPCLAGQGAYGSSCGLSALRNQTYLFAWHRVPLDCFELPVLVMLQKAKLDVVFGRRLHMWGIFEMTESTGFRVLYFFHMVWCAAKALARRQSAFSIKGAYCMSCHLFMIPFNGKMHSFLLPPSSFACLFVC